MVAGGRGKTECPGLKGETGAMCPELRPDCEEAWGSDLLSGRGLLAELALLELALARTWLELANWAPSPPDLTTSESFLPALVLLLSELACSELPDLLSMCGAWECAGACVDGEWLCLWVWLGVCRGGELELGDRELEDKDGHEAPPPLELPFGTRKAALSNEPFVTRTSLRQSPDDLE